jgi:gluconolactonase
MAARPRKYLIVLLFTIVFAGVADKTPVYGQPPKRVFRLEALSPKFWESIGRGTPLITLASGFKFTEGPVWDRSGYLWVSDEKLNKIFRVSPDGKKQAVIAIGDPDGNTYDRRQRLIDCASVLRAIIRLSPDGKSYATLATRYRGKRLNGPNDVVLGPDNALYFTDPTGDSPPGEKQELPFQGVFRLDRGSHLRLLTKEVMQPNGLAFSPDGKKLYVDDDDPAQRNIRVFDVGPGGTLTNGRVFGKEEGSPKDGDPDGMKVDTQGDLYVVGPKGIWVWAPDGNHLGTIILPEQPANLAWGGKDYSTLYITATTSVYKLHTKVRGFVPYL